MLVEMHLFQRPQQYSYSSVYFSTTCVAGYLFAQYLPRVTNVGDLFNILLRRETLSIYCIRFKHLTPSR